MSLRAERGKLWRDYFVRDRHVAYAPRDDPQNPCHSEHSEESHTQKSYPSLRSG